MPVEVHAEALSRRYVVSCCSFAAALHFLLLVATALLPLLAAFASGRETDHRAGTCRTSSACAHHARPSPRADFWLREYAVSETPRVAYTGQIVLLLSGYRGGNVRREALARADTPWSLCSPL